MPTNLHRCEQAIMKGFEPHATEMVLPSRTEMHRGIKAGKPYSSCIQSSRSNPTYNSPCTAENRPGIYILIPDTTVICVVVSTFHLIAD